ncbi:MAG: hypothetical protein KJ734_11290, partial [Chloroflexi bacterium]|nr:hypothetical protein [Chloroflexota bacterium]
MNANRRPVAVFLAVGVVLLIFLASLSFVWAGEYWHTSHGPEGGDILALAADSAGNLYAGAYQGWVFRGTVSGSNLYWTLKNYGFAAQARTVQCVALDESDDIYAGTYGGGVKKSTDDGNTWVNITNSGINSQDVRVLFIDGTTLYAGTARGVNSRLTTALPTTAWSAVGSKWFRTEALALAGGNLYAGVEKGTTVYWGVYRLDGSSWNEMRTGLPADASVYAMVADGDILYASAAVVTDTITGYGVYWCDTVVTTTWQALGALPAGESRQVNALVLDGSTLYAGTENGVYEWSGATWIARNTDPDIEAGQVDSNAHRVRTLLCPASNTLYAGTPGRGVYRTADGGINWATANGTPPDALLSAEIVYAVAVNPAYDWRIYAGTQGGGLHRSPDGGVNWERRSGIIADRAVFALAVTHPSGLPVYAGTDSGIYTTTNGITWTLASNGLTSPESAYVRALVIDPVSSTIVYAGTGDGVYKTTNTGEAWSHQRVNPSPTGSDYFVYSLAIDPITPTIIYAGTQQHGVYRSTDAGDTWADFSQGLTGEALQVNALTVDANHMVFAGVGESSGGIYERRVISATWQNDVTAGVQPAFALLVNPITPTIVLAGTGGRGVLFYGDERYDPPNEWRELNAGLPNYYVYSLAIDDYVTQTLHAGTAGSGVWDFSWGPPPPPPPEMGITKDDGLLEVSLGQLITYTLHYANNGDEVGIGVVITEVIPTYTVLAYSDLAFHSAGGQVYTATVGSMVGGASAQSHFVVRVLTDPVGAPTQLTNYATIRDDGSHGPDPREDNNKT